MSEVFKEYLIKQKKSSKDAIMQTGLCIGAVILGLIAFAIGGPFLGPLLVCGIVFGAYYLFCKLNKEYEYILTNNELDIDVIYNRSSRKRVITLDMKKIDIMASIKDKAHEKELGKAYKVINASENTNEADTYAIIGSNDKYGSFKILITPNEALLNDMYRQSPSKVFKNK